jgi:hypothetical protein
MLRLGSSPANLEINFVPVVSGRGGLCAATGLDLTFRLPGLGDRFTAGLLVGRCDTGPRFPDGAGFFGIELVESIQSAISAGSNLRQPFRRK